MSSHDDRKRILSLVEEGKISAEEAASLLAAMSQGESSPQPATGSGSGSATATAVVRAPSGRARWLKVKVTDQATGRTKVNVTVPLAVVSVGASIARSFVPEMRDLDIDEVIEAARAGESGRLVDVMDAEDGEHVEVYIE